jgi:hypothetical protein
VNPFHLIHKLPFQKRKYKELGIDPINEINKVFGDKSLGFSTLVAGGILLASLFFFFLGSIHIILLLFSVNNSFSAIFYLLSGILSAILSYSYVFINDKYLKYFKIFEAWNITEKRKYYCFTIAFVLLAFFLFALSVSI